MVRKSSLAICGGAFGDEGKGRVVDSFVSSYSQQGPMVIYRDNGGANAGHTVEFDDVRIALHQLPSGVFFNNATVVLGKGMVLHPGDLLTEISQVKSAVDGKIPAKMKIDEMAVLSLDTHRAFEGVLKDWQQGQHGSTGRGISPAYADVLLRHPIRMRDLAAFNQEKFADHYDLYSALIEGLGREISQVKVPTLVGDEIAVGAKTDFIERLKEQANQLEKYIVDVTNLITEAWQDQQTRFIFEKAQAVGLDRRWGVYPDVTASDTTSAGIFASTEGVVDPTELEINAGVLKATYMSSVGVRQLPAPMPEKLAKKIRQDANEFGATTGRPRDILYFDLPAQKYFAKAGRFTHLILTHMDIVYPDESVKICTGYSLNGQPVDYRPDQEFLLKVEPEFKEFAPWKVTDLKSAKDRASLPENARTFIEFLETEFQLPVLMITTGPERGAELLLSD